MNDFSTATRARQATGVAWADINVILGKRQILRDVSLSVAPGSWLALIGPNGAGKTTLLRVLAGAVDHDGQASVGGNVVGTRSAREMARQVAFVPQHPVLPPGLGVFDYVLLGRTPYQGLRFAPSQEDRASAFAVLQRLELDRFADREICSLSGGERQRVVLARALTQETPVLVLDEPTAFLDAGHQLDVLELIEDLRRERNLTVVTTLHDLSVAGQFADAMAVLVDGQVVAAGTPVEVLTADLISRHWGVHAEVSTDDHGGVSVAIQRRRRSTVASDAAAPLPTNQELSP